MLDLNIPKTWLSRILAMEFLNHFKNVGKISSRFPSPFTDLITVSMDKILQFLSVDARIKDFGDFGFFFAINLNWRWRCPGIVDSLYGSSRVT